MKGSETIEKSTDFSTQAWSSDAVRQATAFTVLESARVPDHAGSFPQQNGASASFGVLRSVGMSAANKNRK